MNFENILTASDAGIFTITINRPDKLNALNHKTIQEIGLAIRLANDDAAVRGIIITGSGEKLSRDGNDVFTSIEHSPKPVIAAVNGFALGGGCELAMACHMRIASENARFGQPEVNLGVTPGYAGTQRLVQLIGKGKALEFLMTADVIPATEALNLGLVNHVIPQAELMNKSREILAKIATKGPLAIAAVIRCVNSYFAYDQDGFETEISEFSECFESEDFKEGTRAFLEKRKAEFTGK
jgi:enoyl-CoA hydratase